jgi:type IV secretory pathway VirB2 component (pilin)
MKKLYKTHNILICFSLMLLAMLLPLAALAASSGNTGGAGTDQVVEIMCNVIRYFNKIGKPIIIIVVIMVGTGLFFGKITWGLGITIVVAIAILLGAEDVVIFVTGDGSSARICNNTN